MGRHTVRIVYTTPLAIDYHLEAESHEAAEFEARKHFASSPPALHEEPRLAFEGTRPTAIHRVSVFSAEALPAVADVAIPKATAARTKRVAGFFSTEKHPA